MIYIGLAKANVIVNGELSMGPISQSLIIDDNFAEMYSEIKIAIMSGENEVKEIVTFLVERSDLSALIATLTIAQQRLAIQAEQFIRRN